MPWMIYGKRLADEWFNPNTNKMEQGPDKTFRALDYYGNRVTKIEDAFAYATKEDAEERLEKVKKREELQPVFEIRKVK